MSELLNIYLDNLNIIFNKINKLLINLHLLPIDKFDQTCKDIEINTKEAERMLKQMDLEITTNSDNDKNKTKIIFTNYKKKYDETKSKYFKIKENYTYSKKMDEMIINSQRESSLEINNLNVSENGLLNKQILKNEELAHKSTEKLQYAMRSLKETENIGNNLMVDLESQSQKMNQTHSKLVSLNTVIETSSSVIHRMINRENRNKALIGIFSVTLVTFFLFILSSRL